MKTFNALALGYTGALLSAGCMLLLGILGNLGIYGTGIEQMSHWHMFFSLSFSGIVYGMIEAAISSFIIFYLFGVVYNMFVTKNG